MSGSLSDAMTETRAAEQRRAARAILRRPLLRADGRDAEAFASVRRHAPALREWFHTNTGWALIVNSELARLVKTVETNDAAGEHTHPAVDSRSKQPFTRRRYVLSCLSLAVLSRADAQVTLGRLAERVVLAAADPALVDAGLVFTLERRDERADLVSVVRLLIDYGVLTRVAGDEDAFVNDTGDVLYDVQRRVLSAMLAPARGPSTVDADDFDSRLTRLTEELPATTDELRNRQIRHRITRRLLDEPVLYYDELTEVEHTYLTGQRTSITGKITALTGLVAEVRAEGIAMVDPNDDLTDVRMPEVGTDGHAALLVADYLAGAGSGAAVPVADLYEWIRGQAATFVAQRFWRKGAGEPGAETQIVETALGRLEALRLIRRTPEVVYPRPAIARYGLDEPTVTGDKAPTSTAPTESTHA